jgi:ATP-dependent RNA helicase DeaD
MVRSPFQRITIPKGDEVCRRQLLALVNRAKEVTFDEKEMADFMPEVYNALEGLSREEIIQRFAALEFNRFLAYYRNAPDLNPPDRSSARSAAPGGTGRHERERREFDRRDSFERRSGGGDTGRHEASEGGFRRYFISLGERDRLDRGRLLRILCDVGRLTKNDVGSIDMSDTFSFFELDAAKAEDAIPRLNRLVYENRPVRANAAEDKKDGGGKKKDKKNGFNRRKDSKFKVSS